MTDIRMVDDTHGNERKHEAVAADTAAALPAGEPESSLLMMKDVWMDPCIEFAIKTLTGAIPCMGVEENKADKMTPQSSLSSSAGNLQSCVEELPFGGGGVLALDPCIEFAAKILTGEIPISVDECSPEKPLFKQQQQQKCWLTKFGSNQPILLSLMNSLIFCAPECVPVIVDLELWSIVVI
ncbi:hypothetical protein DM860_016042 [Cuscuta australis]|uniref:Uncharacterized protein n=1 Tax=Cuscuta australis TaxID=267555 RepID=A0A328E6V1_9ASTE|nr:hypothetical protein DM860_016042 [Cuscuta australis]